MLSLNSLLLFSENPIELSDFYSKVYGKKPDWDDGQYYGFQSDSFFLTIGPHDKVKGKNPQPERIMINFVTEDVKKDFERIKKLGAKVVAEPYSMSGEEIKMDKEFWIATFADPDGNIFQLQTPMEF